MPSPARALALVAVAWLAACGGAEPTGTTADAPPADATAAAGTFHNQPISVGGETRYYWLHVPAGLSGPAPLLVDFHGTGFTADEPEIEWGTDELIAASDALGFIVARPRSHSYVAGGQTIFQWDTGQPGDVDANLALASALVAHLRTAYAVAPDRIYATGFSNGTNFALQTLRLPDAPFHGIGLVGGGIYVPFPHPAWGAPAPRIYATTGYRDLNYEFQRDMQAWLAANGYPSERLWIRETKAIHELRGWMFREMFAWLDAGVRPPPGALAAGWRADAASPVGASSLLAAVASADGARSVTAADGAIWRRAVDGTWTAAHVAGGGAPVLVAACMAGSAGFATGETTNLITADGGATWQAAPAIPPYGAADGSASQLFAVACGPGATRVGVGAGLGAISRDAGASWQPTSLAANGGVGFPTAIHRGASGAWLAVGIDLGARSLDGVAYTSVDIGATTRDIYLYDAAEAAPGHWTAVGNDGIVLRSDDDGQTWRALAPLTSDALYAVRFADAARGLAVGLHGTALLTEDGGDTWRAVPAGVDRMLADVDWLDPQHALVVGEAGGALILSVP